MTASTRGAAIASVLLAVAIAAPARAAEPTHFFNAAHSLTGDCSSSAIDRVEDPGCPGGEHPPLGSLDNPWGVAVDPFGDIYVDSYSHVTNEISHTTSHIDIFDPQGLFITEIQIPDARAVAVDSGGHMYVATNPVSGDKPRLSRFDPTVYDPASREIEYGAPPVVLIEGEGGEPEPGVHEPNGSFIALAINPLDDHLYALGRPGATLSEYGSFAELLDPSEPNERLGGPVRLGDDGASLAIDAAHGRVIANVSVKDAKDNPGPSRIKAYEASAPYAEVGAIDGSTIPGTGKFSTCCGVFPVAVSEEDGHVFAEDMGARKIFEFEADGSFVATYASPPVNGEPKQMAYDNWPGSPTHGYLYVPSGETGHDHLFAYEPEREVTPPVVEAISVTGVSEDEAVLEARINPEGQASHYAFEYVTQQEFESAGGSFEAATLAGEGDLPAGGEGVAVTAPAFGLAPGTAYRFRGRVENLCESAGCSDEAEATFSTFQAPTQTGTCANQALRVGSSAPLPDCRAYELVTPADTHGRRPLTPTASVAGKAYATPPASPSGESLGYTISGGPPPGMLGSGGFQGDTYVARRTPGGWISSNAGPLGAESTNPVPTGLSSDHGYSSFLAQGGGAGAGTLVIGGENTAYVRYPDGSFHLVGQGRAEDGSPIIEPSVEVRYISPGGSHIIFENGGQLRSRPPSPLTPDAPPTGTSAIYEHSGEGETQLVSLLPGDVTPAAGENAAYLGNSKDGSAIAFDIGGVSPIYLRVDGAVTLVAAPAGSAFAGLSRDGRYLFYLDGGDFFRFDAEAEETAQITETGDVIPVNVAAQGTAAYFISPTALNVGGNPAGALPVPGENNLYSWDGSGTRFVATVTDRDVEGEVTKGGVVDGLGLWLHPTGGGVNLPGMLSSKVDPTGATLLFVARTKLTDYDSGGMAEVYRYSGAEEALTCLSCDPTKAKPSSDARLVKCCGGVAFAGNSDSLTLRSEVPNLSSDGRRAFFESAERLAPADNDGTYDVYEWEAEGKGSCADPGGCLFLISSGASSGPNYLFGVSETGDDVFIETPDLLLPADQDDTPSVYDARVEGGIAGPPQSPAECLGEACQPAAVVPNDPTPAFDGKGNVVARRCPKGKKLIVRGGSERCAPRHKKHHRKKYKHHSHHGKPAHGS